MRTAPRTVMQRPVAREYLCVRYGGRSVDHLVPYVVMMPTRVTRLLLSIVVLELGACASELPRVIEGDSGVSVDSAGGPLACVPGMQVACTCLGGAQGVQICKSDGSGFEACLGCDGGVEVPDASDKDVVEMPPDVALPDALPEPDVEPAADVATPVPTELDLHDAILFDNPVDLADWPVTTLITAVEFQYRGQDGVHVAFSKLDGPERWPDVTPPGWDGPLQYTLGLAEYIDGQWYASAAIQFWYGLEASGGNVALDGQIARNWYYDSRWGEMAGYQPATGEIIGVFVVAGNVRGVHDEGSQSPVKERSNVVLVPMPDVNGATYTF